MRFMQRNWGTTILLTSSDSEECMRADYVGYLRHGHLHEPSRPTQILDKWSVDSMEKAFYCLAVRSGDLPEDDDIEPFSTDLRFRNNVQNSMITRRRMHKEFRINFPCPASFCTAQGVLMHERFLTLWRNKGTFILLGLIIPLIILLAFYYTIGQEVYKTKIGASKSFYIVK